MPPSPELLPRDLHVNEIERLLEQNPVVGIVGARQVGKTTLARWVAAGRGDDGPPAVFFDLEYPVDQARLADPVLALEPLRGLVVLDEVHHAPGLFPLLRVLADRPGIPARFLVLGSASPDLLRQGSETLAGRIAWHELGPLALHEVGSERIADLWLRGGFPRALLARTDAESATWRRAFVESFLTRDLRGLGISLAPPTLRRFLLMLAHHHGQLWSSATFARAFGMSDKTVRGYLDLLEQVYVIRRLPPWHENLGKRQVKAAKVYLADSGLLHALLDLDTHRALEGHPAIGASWEGFGIEAVIAHLRARRDQCFFWRTHNGAELDLLVVRGRGRLGFELKRAAAPTLTPSMRIALADLAIDRLLVLHAGTERYPLAERIEAVPLARLAEALEAG